VTGAVKNVDERFRTVPPTSGRIDPYTGYPWCAKWLHLLAPWTGHLAPSGGCRTCAAARPKRTYKPRSRTRSKQSTP
jgi:hypothetical protein